jgi:hypothetical protein
MTSTSQGRNVLFFVLSVFLPLFMVSSNSVEVAD